jgi:RNA-directed DNA polymerase
VAAVENTAPSPGGSVELGVRSQLASNTAGSGRGPWYLARAKALSVGLSNAYFKSLGLPTLIEGC